ncbi:MAG: ABC transporter ATP-binding protein [Deltaproteobacteria bacterium]|nr:ABC transporter ATP-binding protein [Deltaproteobacteria bacterium]
MNKAVVEVKDLKREYVLKGETIKALDGVSLTVAEGEFMAIAGPSGSGKTTLLNLIGGLDSATAGTVLIHGQDVADLSGHELARLRRDKIGFIFQAYNLIPVLSAQENVEYVMLLQGRSKKEQQDRARAVLSEVGLEGLERRRPGELSGGQQQRVAVARAIVAEPALILADEPTANLDSKTGGRLLEIMALLNQKRGVTFVFSSHDQKVLRRASRLVKLRDGRLESDEENSG